MPRSSLDASAVRAKLPSSLKPLGSMLCMIGAQLLTIAQLLGFTYFSDGSPSGGGSLHRLASMLCFAGFVALSLHIYRILGGPNIPDRRWWRISWLLVAIYVIAWSTLAVQTLRPEAIFLPEQIGWSLLFCITVSLLLPQSSQVDRLLLAQTALQTLVLAGTWFAQEGNNDASRLPMLGIAALLCVSKYLSLRRADENIAQDQRLAEQISQTNLLQRQVTFLHQTHVSKARLLAMMSHDLRQPMHALGLMLERIRHTATQFSSNAEVDAVSNVSHSLASSLDMLMTVTRLNSGDIVPLPEAVALKPLFDALYHEFKDAADRHALRLTFDPGHLHVQTDPNLLRSILTNLISNAIKYSNEGEISIDASVNGEGSVKICVRDQGLGIAPNDLQRIFDPFVRLDLRSTDAEGMGLGLAIVRQLTDLIKAPLEIQSTIGIGSTFSFDLPRAQPLKQVGDVDVHASLRGLLVALIDNDNIVLESMRQTLEGWSCQVIAAPNWLELKALLDGTTRQIDLILSDFHLDGKVSGQDLICELRNRQKSEIPSILLTGDVNVRFDSGTAARHVVIAYKPLSTNRLAMLIYETTAATVAR